VTYEIFKDKFIRGNDVIAIIKHQNIITPVWVIICDFKRIALIFREM